MKTILVIDDGSDVPDSAYESYGGVEFYAAAADSSAERDFGPRSADDIYLLYTGGTTGFPKGVMWRHEGHLPGAVRWNRLRHRRIHQRRVRPGQGGRGQPADGPPPDSADDPRRHPVGHLDVDLLGPNHRSGTGIQCRRGVAHHPRQQSESAVLHRRRDGEAVARRAVDTHRTKGEGEGAYDLSSLFLLASTAALFSPSIKEKFLELLPNRVITDSIGSSETGFGGTSIVAKDAPHSGGPRVTIDQPDRRPSTMTATRSSRAPESAASSPRRATFPSAIHKDEKKTAETFKTIDGVRYAIPGDWATVEEDGSVTMLGRGSVSINSGGEKIYPEEVEAALKGHPDVFDALVVGVPDRPLRPACGPPSCNHGPERSRRWPTWMASSVPRSRDTKCRAAFGSSTR